MKKSLLLTFLVSVLAISMVAQGNREALSPKGIDRIVKEVHHELVMLPFYGVFDNLAYKVDPDGTVTLLGQVSRPTLKSDAENVVKRIEGVEKVVNNIEVLPTSINDDNIRRAVYRAHSHHREERKCNARGRGRPRHGQAGRRHTSQRSFRRLLGHQQPAGRRGREERR